MKNTYKEEVNKKYKELIRKVIENLGKKKNFSKDVVSTSDNIIKVKKVKNYKELLKYLKRWEKEKGTFDIDGLDGGLLFPEIYEAYLRKMQKQRKKPKRIF